MITFLKKVRKEKKVTQRDVAEAVGCRRETIVNLERGTYNPSLRLADRIARYFETPISTLFNFDDEAEKISDAEDAEV